MKKITVLLSLIFIGLIAFGQHQSMDAAEEEKLMMQQQLKETYRDIHFPAQKDIMVDYSKGLTFPGVIDLLILTPDTDGSEAIRSALDGYGHINATSFPQADLPGLSLSDLTPYDVILTFNNNQWLDVGGVSPDLIGDLLADYIDQGGLFVESLYVMDFDGWQVGGAYMADGYSAFEQATQDFTGVRNMGTVHEPAHPIMTDVNSFGSDGSTLTQDNAVADGATPIVDWDNGQILVAAKDQVVSFNILTMAGGALNYIGDGTTLYNNAVTWLVLNQADPAAPGEPANLAAAAGDMGALEVELSWDNPDETVGGDPLTELDAVHVYRNGDLIHTINDPAIGGSETYTDTEMTEPGVYGYAVAGENAEGEGFSATVSLYVGEDVPAAPENIELVADGNDGVLTWDAPTSGLNDGYFTGDNLTYTVVRFPCDVEVATDITQENYTDTDVPGVGNYYYTVIASNDVGEGGIGESNVALLGAGDLLLFETFEAEGVFPPTGWSYVDGGVGSYWEQSSVSSYTGDFSARSYQGMNSDNLADEWLITPLIDMDDPNAQMLTFYGYSSQAPDGTRENMRILAVDQLYDNVTDLHANATLLEVVPFEGEWTEHVVDISSLNGDKHLIFNYYITAADNATFNWIYVDHVMVGDFDSFTLTMEEPVGEGTVVPEVGDHIYLEGTEVTVSASADMGWDFSHWTGDVDDPDSPVTTILMDDDKTVQAVFVEFDGLDLPWTEKFDGVPIGEMPSNWERTHDNWAVNDSDNAGGEAPELRFNFSPSAIDVFRAITPRIDASDVDHVMLTFLYSVNDFSGNYDLKVQTSLDGETWTDQWVLGMKQSSRTSDDRDAPSRQDVPPTEEDVILTNVGGEEFYLAFVFDGDSWNINQWYIDDIFVGDAPDMYEVTFHVKEDSADEDPIEGAMISVDGEQLETGADGMASIMLVDDTYTANITASGYVAQEVTFTVDGDDKTVDVYMMDDIVQPFNLEVELVGTNEALLSWNEADADLMLLYQHDGTIPPDPNAFWQLDERAYGTIFDLSAYPDATVSFIDFHHLQWGVPDDTYEYLVHIVDWSNYDIIETVGPLFTEENDDWEMDVDLGDIDVSGYSQVGILIQPQGFLPDDAYPCITADATGPNGVSLHAPVDDLSDFLLNSPEVGDFFINLWIITAHTDKEPVKAERLLANHAEKLETRTGQSMSATEAYFNQNTHVRGLPQNSKAFLGFNVYLDGDLVAEEIAETEYLFTDLPDDMTFTAGVRSVYTTGESEVSTIEFEVPAIPIANWAIYTTALLIGLFVFFRIRKVM